MSEEEEHEEEPAAEEENKDEPEPAAEEKSGGGGGGGGGALDTGAMTVPTKKFCLNCLSTQDLYFTVAMRHHGMCPLSLSLLLISVLHQQR